MASVPGRTTTLVAVMLSATLAFAGLLAPAAQAATLVGKPCKKAGVTQGDGPGRTVICTKITKGKKKGKLVWKLVKGGGGQPGPTPSPTPDPVGSIPAVIESWGIDVGSDLYVGAIPFPADSVIQAPIQYYGEGPRRPQDPPDFVDPQMTFVVPQGTVVRAIVSGTVCSVTYLNTGYSDDYSIGVGVAVGGKPACQSDPGSGQGFGTVATWEHEHVMEPQVKPGDTVKAGQPIAIASYYTTREWLYAAGYALYEIGILAPSPDGRPMHVCPALYLAPAKKESLLADLASAALAYEVATGQSHYAEKTLATGCITQKPAFG